MPRMTPAGLIAKGYGMDGNKLPQFGNAGRCPATVREAELHRKILDYCQARGWPRVYSRMDVPSTAGIGTPDFVIAMPDAKTLWIEAKVGGGKVRPEQAAWIASLRILGHRARVVWSFDEFLEEATR